MLKLKHALLALALLAAPLLFVPATTLAVDPFEQNVCDSNFKGDKPAVCVDKDATQPKAGTDNNPLFGKEGILTRVINLLSLIVGIVAVIIIILAGLKFVTSGSNPQDIANARERLIYAAVGLVIAALAQVLVRFIIGKVG